MCAFCIFWIVKMVPNWARHLIWFIKLVPVNKRINPWTNLGFFKFAYGRYPDYLKDIFKLTYDIKINLENQFLPVKSFSMIRPVTFCALDK